MGERAIQEWLREIADGNEQLVASMQEARDRKPRHADVWGITIEVVQRYVHCIRQAADRIDALEAESARLRGIVDRLDKTPQGEPITVRCNFWSSYPINRKVCGVGVVGVEEWDDGESGGMIYNVRNGEGQEFWALPHELHSTEQAAREAMEAGQ